MPAVTLTIRCECGKVNTRQAMPPVRRVGEHERCYCGPCGGITDGEILERTPDIEIQQGVFGNGTKLPTTPQVLLAD